MTPQPIELLQAWTEDRAPWAVTPLLCDVCDEVLATIKHTIRHGEEQANEYLCVGCCRKRVGFVPSTTVEDAQTRVDVGPPPG